MRILANVNIPAAAVAALETTGHDVAWVSRISPGAGDREVLTRVAQEHRVIVTFDKNFGELACRSRLPADAGVILCRFAAESPERLAERLAAAFSLPTQWQGMSPSSRTTQCDRSRSLSARRNRRDVVSSRPLTLFTSLPPNMKRTHEDLEALQQAMELLAKTYPKARSFPKGQYCGLTSQTCHGAAPILSQSVGGGSSIRTYRLVWKHR